MRNALVHKLEILLLATLIVASSSVTQQKPSGVQPVSEAPDFKLQPNPIFAAILPLLEQKTRVPLRLPSYVPFSEQKSEASLRKDQGEENLYATIDEVSEKSYAIQLAFGKDCEGSHGCRDGGLTGSSVFHDQYPERPKVPVKLRGGITGRFVDSECGAYCDESVLYWSENGYHYSVSSKAATKKKLVQIANSAIEVAQAQAKAVHDNVPSANRQSH